MKRLIFSLKMKNKFVWAILFYLIVFASSSVGCRRKTTIEVIPKDPAKTDVEPFFEITDEEKEILEKFQERLEKPIESGE